VVPYSDAEAFRASRVNEEPPGPAARARGSASPRSNRGAIGQDFDARSWFWMVLFGIVLPGG
jgi:hypothetical protein